MNPRLVRKKLRAIALALAVGMLIAGPAVHAASDGAEVERLREIERKRLRALVEADVDTAMALHAEDFQLINPLGGSLSREQYLGAIRSGAIDYIVWEPASDIAVRLHGTAAVIRYRARLEIVVQGTKFPQREFWHTDLYEKRDGRWQVAWSQATEIAPRP